jgi:peroxiredoxin Q/BCP
VAVYQTIGLNCWFYSLRIVFYSKCIIGDGTPTRPKPSIHDGLVAPHLMTTPVELSTGDKSPLFNCLDSSGQRHDLEEYMKDDKKVILYFYPRDSTPGCTKQACDFRDNIAQLAQHGYVVLGVSKDSESSHEKFITKQNLNFPLLMDTDGSLHELFGTWRIKKNYGREYLGCVRSTFVLDSDGTVAWCRYNVRAKGHVGMLLRELGIES